MKLMKAILASSLVMSSAGVYADSKLPAWLDVSGTINFDGLTTRSGGEWDGEFRVQDAELRFEIMAREGVKLVLKAELEKLLNQAIDGDDIDVEIGQIIEEAYIQLQTDKFGMPRAVITLGKQRMAFGQKLTQMPMFKDSLLYQLNNEEEMIGLTVALPANFFKVVDQIAFSLYETGAGDLKISSDKGFSVQMSKRLTAQVEAQISALMKEQTGADDEIRASLGFVYTGNEGSMQVWANGVVMDNNLQYINSRYGATLGAAHKLGLGAIVVEGSFLEKYAKEVAVGYNLPVGAHLVLSPEARYRKNDNGTDETVLGIRARLAYGKNAGPQVGPR